MANAPAWLVHGGRVSAARAAFPDAPLPWVDLSTALNPRSYPIAPIPAEDWAALPDEEAFEGLRSAAALAFAAPPGSVHPLPGTEAGIRLLASLDVPQPVRVVSPCYGSYRDAWPAAEPIRYDETAGVVAGTVVLANPNNPDGICRSPAELLDLGDRLAARGGFLVVDEAFADVAPQASLCPHLAERPHLAVLRSFGKFFGLGGVRLGFLLNAGPVGTGVRHRLGAWPVSTGAIRWGTQAYRDDHWMGNARRELAASALRMDRLLRDQGLDASGECPLFRLVESPHCDSLFPALARRGILTRPFSYEPNWLRLGLPGDEQAWNRFGAALAAAMEEIR